MTEGNVIVRVRSRGPKYEAKLCFKHEDPEDDWIEIGLGNTEEEARNDLLLCCIGRLERHKGAYEVISNYLSQAKEDCNEKTKKIFDSIK